MLELIDLLGKAIGNKAISSDSLVMAADWSMRQVIPPETSLMGNWSGLATGLFLGFIIGLDIYQRKEFRDSVKGMYKKV